MTTAHSTKDDILNALLRQGQITAQKLAAQLSVSPQAIRRHLKDLEAEGLIEFEVTHEGMGRPQHVYKLSRAGRDR
ncbi:MAG: winged helix-turn-helix transcriptional regulator, partial [Cyanobacteria bacterium P01_A01_bin.17]